MKIKHLFKLEKWSIGALIPDQGNPLDHSAKGLSFCISFGIYGGFQVECNKRGLHLTLGWISILLIPYDVEVRICQCNEVSKMLADQTDKYGEILRLYTQIGSKPGSAPASDLTESEITLFNNIKCSMWQHPIQDNGECLCGTSKEKGDPQQ